MPRIAPINHVIRVIRGNITSMKCPTCKKETEYAGNPYRPFCSERCKLIDLGKWAGGEYRMPTKERPTEEVHRSNGNREDEE
jgi:uncharacterized protein